MASYLDTDLPTSRTPGSVTTNSWNRLQRRKRNTQCCSPNFSSTQDFGRSTCIDSFPRFTRSLRRCGSLATEDVEATTNPTNAQESCESHFGLFLGDLNSPPNDNMNRRHGSALCETKKFKLRGDSLEALQSRIGQRQELTSGLHPPFPASPDGTPIVGGSVNRRECDLGSPEIYGHTVEANQKAHLQPCSYHAAIYDHQPTEVGHEANATWHRQRDQCRIVSPTTPEVKSESAIPVGDSEGVIKAENSTCGGTPGSSKCWLGRSHSTGPEVIVEGSNSRRCHTNRAMRSIWMGSPNCASGDSEVTCETAVSECNFGGFRTAHEFLPQGEGTADRTIATVAPLIQYPHTLCWCPCLNCATCPLRATSRNCKSKAGPSQKQPSVATKLRTSDGKPEGQGHNKKLQNPGLEAHTSSVDSEVTSNSNSCCNNGCYRGISRTFRKIWDGVLWIYFLEAKDDPKKYRYDSRVIPEVPLPRRSQRLLEITELPFLILWVYFSYWALIVSLAAPHAPSTVWLSAVVAGLLVGIGLNANAYKSVTVPRRRGAIRHHRHARALLELRRYGESLDTVEMKIDWGMVIRFFIIPFGVSSLSGLTNYMREDFLLVFPRDPVHLMIAILCPTVIVTLLVVLRLLLLWRLRVRWSLQVLFLNGALVD